jgi:hypothetical protein
MMDHMFQTQLPTMKSIVAFLCPFLLAISMAASQPSDEVPMTDSSSGNVSGGPDGSVSTSDGASGPEESSTSMSLSIILLLSLVGILLFHLAAWCILPRNALATRAVGETEAEKGLIQ